MQDKKLNFRQYVYLSSMIFGLFFGAGNLIFPIFMGHQAGNAVKSANIGFLLTGVGLPFLAVLAMGVMKSNTLIGFGQQVSERFGKILAVLMLLIIGPLFAMPRLATTTFEVGVASYLPSETIKISLAILSIVFFGLTWWFARKPSQLLDYVGKFLNPFFLILLAIIILFAFIQPIGSSTESIPSLRYSNNTLLMGITDGYQTLDAVAGIAFGVIIITTLNNLGVKSPAGIARSMSVAGVFSMLFMAIIYSLLAYMGAMSQSAIPQAANGGVILAHFAQHYLGIFGAILLAFIVFTACLKTSIGLATSFAETFSDLFPRFSYQQFLAAATLTPAIIANVGLNQIISLSLPVLMFIYPLTMVLIFLTLANAIVPIPQIIFKLTTYFTMIGAMLDAFKTAQKELFSHWNLGIHISQWLEQFIPGYKAGISWIIPALLGLVLSIVFVWVKTKDKRDFN